MSNNETIFNLTMSHGPSSQIFAHLHNSRLSITCFSSEHHTTTLSFSVDETTSQALRSAADAIDRERNKAEVVPEEEGVLPL